MEAKSLNKVSREQRRSAPWRVSTSIAGPAAQRELRRHKAPNSHNFHFCNNTSTQTCRFGVSPANDEYQPLGSNAGGGEFCADRYNRAINKILLCGAQVHGSAAGFRLCSQISATSCLCLKL